MGDIVSREQTPKAPRRPPLTGLLEAWRAILTRTVITWSRGAQRAASRVRRGAESSSHTLRAARSGSATALERVALPAGLVAILAGIVTAVFMAPEGTLNRALPAAVLSAMWAAARLPAMRIVATGHEEVDSLHITPAWALGVALHVFAATPILRLVTWAAGLAITYRALRSAGVKARSAASIAGWGYGLEVAGFVVVSIIRNIQVAIALLGGGPS